MHAVGISTGAVLAQWLGLGVQRAEVRQTHRAPWTEHCLAYGSGNAQHVAVMLLGAGNALAPAAEEQGYTHPELWCCLSQFVSLGSKLAVEDLAARGFHVDGSRAVHDAGRLRRQAGIAAAIDEAAEVLFTHGQLTDEQASTLLMRHHAPGRLTPPVWTPPEGGDTSGQTPKVRPRAVRDLLARVPLATGIEQTFSRMHDTTRDLHSLAERLEHLEQPDDTETG
ncbi:hypothetical protein EEJ42_07420 [Streptomyces botrytidirepellens]|uniref:Uncharacterized protein n=1 Tax=Streptomyces botrytidirepellens TaxID=2486417 RepID=A0A3M8WYB7_9ACTN|nr:hypothetical protein EEJ42_07420 [Streptomyces botrytidirepellens]